ncbi:hypothetical protein [Helicobacter suis]|nr:hypothetical protein [Helicobacter suis]
MANLYPEIIQEYRGKGLGLDFLYHLERAYFLLFVLDSTFDVQK